MEVDCAGCAGCCLDWRPLTPAETSDHERRGPAAPLDERYNLVPLTRDDIHGLIDAGYGNALRPRLWTSTSDDRSTVTIDGVPVVAIEGRPIFMIGVRQPPKPVAPFGTEPQWLRTCAFLDPTTLQCRIHDTDSYPDACSHYPGHQLQMDVDTECERVEQAVGGKRLRERTVPDEVPPPPFGPQALGWTVFAHPEPNSLTEVITRMQADELTHTDRAEFIGVAAGHSPGTIILNEQIVTDTIERIRETTSWIGAAIEDWSATTAAGEEPDPKLAKRIEEQRGAPATPGWHDTSTDSNRDESR